PIYLILLGFSSQPDFKTFVKFFIYTLAGSLFMFIAILYVYIKAPGGNFSIDNFYNNHLSEQEQVWVFLGFFIAYAIKIPIIPFHTWQPDTYTKASTPGTMLLSGVMLKMGTFSLLRWLLPVAPLALATVTPVVIILCIIGIVYGSIIAIRQKNIKTLFAYSSLAHVGLISAGVFALNADGFNGALIQMFNHGIIIVGLFLIAEIIYTRTETYHISELGGIRNEAPTLAFTFLIIILASVALPLTNGFVGEFLLLNGVFQYNQWMAVVGGTTVILSATYMLRMYQRTMLGLDRDYTKTILDLGTVEKIMVLGLVLIIIVTGIWPSILLDPIKPAVENLLNIIKIVQ
ncbi:MAG TPA: NADH-quinone oxidoreductase subunit M, partial [Saprospiraceae bacterium]|nr:NADH-quinone oxidoreductase subunit M [Saprospiraceae bacterium]